MCLTSSKNIYIFIDFSLLLNFSLPLWYQAVTIYVSIQLGRLDTTQLLFFLNAGQSFLSVLLMTIIHSLMEGALWSRPARCQSQTSFPGQDPVLWLSKHKELV